MVKRWNAIRLAAIMSAIAIASAWAQTAEISDLESQITELKARRDIEFPKALKAHLAIKAENQAEFKKQEAKENELRIEGAEIEKQRPIVESICGRTVPLEQKAAADAECQAVLIPFNARVDKLNDASETLQKESKDLVGKEASRVEEAKSILEEKRLVEKKLERLQRELKAAKALYKFKICIDRCAKQFPGDEAAARCMSICFDEASKEHEMVGLPPVPIPPFRVRTQKEAIEEYEKSGKASPIPKQRPNVVPPPPCIGDECLKDRYKKLW